MKLRSFAASIILMSFFSFLTFPPTFSPQVNAQEFYYTYYGVVPAKIYMYGLIDGNVLDSGWKLKIGHTNSSMIAISAIKDNTQVRVHILDNGTLVSETTLNRMGKHYVVLRNGTRFKVETTELASVMLLNYGSVPFGNETSLAPQPNTFYMSTTGAYSGKEFIFIASQSIAGTDYLAYLIIALEDADITVTKEDGTVRTYSLMANTYQDLILNAFNTYRVESTGNVMIQSGRPLDKFGTYRSFFVPAVEGGFLGKNFYSGSTDSWDPLENYGFHVSATQDTTVTVWNLETKELLMSMDITGGNGLGFKPQAPAITVQSTMPVTLMYVHNGSLTNSLGTNGTYDAYGSGVSYIGIRPNEDTPVYFPVDCYIEAYIFASQATQVTVDGLTRNIAADSCFLLTQTGTHIIRSDKNVVIEVLAWPAVPRIQGLQYNGVQIPCVQTVDVVSDVTLTPLEESFPITYVVIGAVATAIAVVVVFLLRKKHS